MTTRKTCDRCAHYAAMSTYGGTYPARGSCDKALDWNDVPRASAGLAAGTFVDQVAAWDYEGYRAGVYVAPKFGCIHWAKKT